MLGSYRAELLKLRKRSAVWVLFAAGLVLSLTFGYLLPYLSYATGRTATSRPTASRETKC